MDRDTFRRRLAETEEQLANGLSHIAQQCKLIVELESNGRPTDHARYLLAGTRTTTSRSAGQPRLAVETTEQKYEPS